MLKKYHQKVSPSPVGRGTGGEGSRAKQTIKTIQSLLGILPLLLLTLLAPACAPNEPPPPTTTVPQNLVLLTDTSQWRPSALAAYKDSLTNQGYRVIVSGYPGETAAELTGRLPWLLQPGVDLFLYDEKLAGASGLDSLVNYLKAQKHLGEVRLIGR